MRKARIAAGALAASLVISAVPAAAAGGNSVSVSGKRHVAAGHSPVYTITGHASGLHGLAVYTDTQACARKVVKEQRRRSSSSPTVFSVSGSFRHTVQVRHSKVGSHYICAYVYHRKGSSFATDAHAGLHYTTR